MTIPAPYFRAHIFCCTNQRPAGHKLGCCFSKGAETLRNYMKQRAKELGLADVRVNNAGCLDRCAEGPVLVVYPEGVWYRPTSTADIDAILETLTSPSPASAAQVQHLMLPATRPTSPME